MNQAGAGCSQAALARGAEQRGQPPRVTSSAGPGAHRPAPAGLRPPQAGGSPARRVPGAAWSGWRWATGSWAPPAPPAARPAARADGRCAAGGVVRWIRYSISPIPDLIPAAVQTPCPHPTLLCKNQEPGLAGPTSRARASSDSATARPLRAHDSISSFRRHSMACGGGSKRGVRTAEAQAERGEGLLAQKDGLRKVMQGWGAASRLGRTCMPARRRGCRQSPRAARCAARAP